MKIKYLGEIEIYVGTKRKLTAKIKDCRIVDGGNRTSLSLRINRLKAIYIKYLVWRYKNVEWRAIGK